MINITDTEGEGYFKRYDNLVELFYEKVIDKHEKKRVSDKETTKENISDVIIVIVKP